VAVALREARGMPTRRRVLLYRLTSARFLGARSGRLEIRQSLPLPWLIHQRSGCPETWLCLRECLVDAPLSNGLSQQDVVDMLTGALGPYTRAEAAGVPFLDIPGGFASSTAKMRRRVLNASPL
jgi:hypothetical protein